MTTGQDDDEPEGQVELNVRQSQNGAMLNVHVPQCKRNNFSQGLKVGHIDTTETPTFLQLTVLDDWIVDREVREQVAKLKLNIHVRIPLTSMHVNFTE